MPRGNNGYGRGQHKILSQADSVWSGVGDTLEDKLAAAGMDWTPELIAAQFTFTPHDDEVLLDTDVVQPDGRVTRFGEGYDVVRSDNHRSVANVGSRYKTIPYAQAFAPAADERFADRLEFLSMGEFDGGRQGFLQARLLGDDEIADGDVQQRFIYLRTSHNGTTRFEAFESSLCLFCENQLPMLSRRADTNKFSIGHTESGVISIPSLAQYLDAANLMFDNYTQQARRLLKTSVSLSQLDQFLDRLLPIPNIPLNKGGEENIAVRRAKDARLAIIGRFINPDRPWSAGNAWGLLNAVTGYYDHDAKLYGSNGMSENALAGLRIKKLALDGTEAQKKFEAYALLCNRAA